MRTPVTLLLLLQCCIAASAQIATTSTPASSQPTEVAIAAVAAFSSAPVRQIRLTGTAKAYAGSLQPTGTFTVTLQATGETKLQLSLAELSRTETTGPFADPRHCQWAGQDGVMHDVAHHNCQLAVSWLIPVLDLQSRLTKLNQNVTAETDQGTAVQDLSLTQPPGDTSPSAALISMLSTAKLSLDASTLRPTSLSFNIHPDADAGLNIPIVVRYSDYRQVNGVTLPFHIQKYLNNGLALDLQVESAEVQ